ncbi:4Fe-4S ferredoxin, partial [Clostridioides difficile]
MPFVITEHCIHEQAADCLDVCPVDCIVKGEDQYF